MFGNSTSLPSVVTAPNTNTNTQMRQRQQREHIQEPWLCLWFFVDIVISPEQLMSNMPESMLVKDVTFKRVRNGNPRLTAALLVLQDIRSKRAAGDRSHLSPPHFACFSLLNCFFFFFFFFPPRLVCLFSLLGLVVDRFVVHGFETGNATTADTRMFTNTSQKESDYFSLGWKASQINQDRLRILSAASLS
jgi:hypothetical protein